MVEQGRSRFEIASEIRKLTNCSLLAAYRLALGISQTDVVQKYAEIAPNSSLDQTVLSRIEGFPNAGSRAPMASQITVLASIYGVSPLQLIDPDALDQLAEHERAVLLRCGAATEKGLSFAVPSYPTSPGIITRAFAKPNPKILNVSSTAPDLERQVAMAARRATNFMAIAEQTNVGPETIDQFREEVRRLSSAYPRSPLADLMGDMTGLQDLGFRLLEGNQRPSDTTDLYLMVGILCGMLAKASHDLGNPHAAMAQARTAFVCADRIGHDGLKAWTAGLRSMFAYWQGRPAEAVKYAREGANVVRGGRGTASIWLAAQAARSQAVLGDGEAALAAIAKARHLRDEASHDELDELGGIMTFPVPRQGYYEADALVWLPGEEQHAEEAAAAAIAAYESAPAEDQSFSDQAGALADLALARINSGRVDGAADAMQPVLELQPGRRIEGIKLSVQRVHRALSAPGVASPVSRDLQGQIESFCRTPAAAILPPGR